MHTIIIVDHDRITSGYVIDGLKKYQNVQVIVAKDARQAVTIADTHQPDLVLCELSLAGHSGLEFLYEFRTYPDWFTIPIAIYTSVKLPDIFMKNRDWKLLDIDAYFYKPKTTLVQVIDWITDKLELS